MVASTDSHFEVGMITKRVLAGLSLVVAANCCAADDLKLDGNHLLRVCGAAEVDMDRGTGARDPQGTAYCVGLVRGAQIASIQFAPMLQSQYKLCAPDGVNNGQMIRIVTKYLRDHPEQLQMDDGVLALMGYMNAFACKE
jgi:hypothetical protein